MKTNFFVIFYCSFCCLRNFRVRIQDPEPQKSLHIADRLLQVSLMIDWRCVTKRRLEWGGGTIRHQFGCIVPIDIFFIWSLRRTPLFPRPGCRGRGWDIRRRPAAGTAWTRPDSSLLLSGWRLKNRPKLSVAMQNILKFKTNFSFTWKGQCHDIFYHIFSLN